MLKKFKKQSPIETYEIKSYLDGHIFCLDENTEIYTFRNRIKKMKLKSLPSSFKVVSYNFNKKKQEIKDAKMINTGEQECYEIGLEKGKKIIATGEHVFFTKDNKEIKVKNMKLSDRLLCFSSISGNLGMSKRLYNRKMGFRFNHTPWHKNKTKKDFPQLKRKGNKNYFGHKLSEKNIELLRNLKLGKPRLDMVGDKNVSKRLSVRKKLRITSKGCRNGMFGRVHKPHYGRRIFVNELGYYVRSSWEKNVALKLKKYHIKFKYENKVYKLGQSTYIPDFNLEDEKIIEVKGFIYDKKNIVKLKLFRKKYPNVKMIAITGKQNFKTLSFFDKIIDYRKFIKSEKLHEIFTN